MFGLPINIKIVAALVISALLFVGGYWVGSSIVTADWKSEVAARDKATADAMTKMNEHTNQLNQDLTTAVEKSAEVKTVVKTETIEVEKEVIKYVQEYVDRDVCVLDDEWVRIYNNSAARTNIITSTTNHRDMSTSGATGERSANNSFIVIEAEP